MNILVTGHRGYIGTHLVDVLKQSGHRVTGADIGLFDGCEWETPVRPDRELMVDVRDMTENDLEGHDVVMHLAAISNDPMGALDAGLTLEVNRDASIRLAEMAKAAGVPRFLFAGSCSVYGQGERLDLDENDALNPLTAYAQSKIETEQAIWGLSDVGFSPASLRNSTAYGHSPNLRIDLVVNNLLASALSYGEIRIQSDGSPWRPLINCRDIARAFLAFAEAPAERIHCKAINVGANSENYQVKDVGNLVQHLIPTAKVAYTGEVGADPRNYRVKFDLLKETLPDFKLQYNLASGMEELFRKYQDFGFDRTHFEGDRFVRLRSLKHRMHKLSRPELALA